MNQRHSLTKDSIHSFDVLPAREPSNSSDHDGLLSALFHAAPECIKLQNRDGIILQINQAGLNLLHAERQDSVVGHTIFEFLLPEYHSAYKQLTDEVYLGKHRCMEFEIRGVNNHCRWLETHATPLLNVAGEVTALLAITRDIDARKKAEAALNAKQQELNHIARLSTMGSMASTLAHELNQPLCAISSFTETAISMSSNHSPQIATVLEKVVTQSKRASDIIHHLRAFVKKQSPTRRAIIVQSLIQDTIELLEPRMRHQNISINLKAPDNLPLLMVDRVQIEQVLINIIDNAIQAVACLPIANRKIEVSVKYYENESLLFRISNAGKPLTEEQVSKLFTPFYTTKPSGMGMGLVISRSIIEAHNGELKHEASALGGACFVFTLPIALQS